ncbi:MAG TPA: aquaporin family protein [Planctomycetaceae bacterium]|nr:aquaporin family protein [Planctomycetaceae bacterium]
MDQYVAEFVGTGLLLLLGNGVVGNVVLERTKGHGAGWIVITLGWGMAVFVAVFCVMDISGAHINPAVTIGLAAAGRFGWDQTAGYLVAQLLGGTVGATLVYLFYRDHYRVTSDPEAKLATFCTAPSIRNLPLNLVSEVIGTFVLVFAVLMAAEPSLEFTPGAAGAGQLNSAKLGLGALGALPVGLLVLAIGLSLGGTTGYAINPARDLGPRIAHALLPIPGKRDSDWSYAWVPVVGPIVGGVLAALVAGAMIGT